MISLAHSDSSSAHAILHEEALALDDFLALLRHEEQVLVDGNAQELQSLAARKSASLAVLNEIGLRRKTLVATAGMPPSAMGVADWLESQPQSAVLLQTWNRVLQAATTARELNRSNGLLIKARLHRTQQALDILLAGGNNPALYGPDGQTRASAARRKLVSA